MAKKKALDAERDEDKTVDSDDVSSKIDEVIESHAKIGKVLEGLKEKLEKPKECKPDTRGWDNIVEFFNGPEGGEKASKLIKFLGMLTKMETPEN